MCCDAYVYDEYITSIMRARCAEDTLLSTNGAQTKRPKIKRPKGQNVSRDKTSQGTKRPRNKTSQGHNVPRDKTSLGTKCPTLITKFSKTNFVLENWPHMLGNGSHPCTQFMIGVFLF